MALQTTDAEGDVFKVTDRVHDHINRCDGTIIEIVQERQPGVVAVRDDAGERYEVTVNYLSVS